jgi:hypothetical protein
MEETKQGTEISVWDLKGLNTKGKLKGCLDLIGRLRTEFKLALEDKKETDNEKTKAITKMLGSLDLFQSYLEIIDNPKAFPEERVSESLRRSYDVCLNQPEVVNYKMVDLVLDFIALELFQETSKLLREYNKASEAEKKKLRFTQNVTIQV